MTRCPVSQAEIDNDQPYRKFNRDVMEEHDRATENLRQERREFICSLMEFGYASVKSGRERKNYDLADAIEMISNQNFWNTEIIWDKQKITLEKLVFDTSDTSLVEAYFLAGELQQWHDEIHKQVVLLADMALGEV